MYELDHKELVEAWQLAREGKFEAAFQLVNDFEQRRENTPREILLGHLAKCQLLILQGLYRDAIEIAEQTYKSSLELDDKLISVDSLYSMTLALLNSNNLERVEELIKQAEDLLNITGKDTRFNMAEREGNIYYLKGMYSDPNINPQGDAELALRYYQKCLELGESTDNKERVNAILLRSAWLIGLNLGDLTRAFNYIERSLKIAIETNYRLLIAWSLLCKGTMYQMRGEVIKSIPLFTQSLDIAKELNHPVLISGNLNNLAGGYRMIGEFDRALECSQQSIELFSKGGDLKGVANFHDFLIQILIDKDDIPQARHFLNELEQMKNKLNDKTIDEIYLYDKALLLKESSRISNRGEAEKILKQILKEEPTTLETKQNSLLVLCDLLLSELQMTGDLEVLEEVELIITQLLELAENSHLFWLLGETHLLQAKLALISLDFEESRRLMTKGQEIAEEYGLKLLARKISNEH
ncbi:MAG: tetratricopeptide repeat protein, partial [Promethearchaeota archaeon]